MSIRLISILAAAASLAGAGSALAQIGLNGPSEPLSSDEVVVAPTYVPPGAELRQEAVFFGDLDIDSHAGANTLMHRISAAAQRVCSPPGTYPDEQSDIADYNRCMAQAIGRTVDQVDAPALTDVYQARYAYHRSGEGW
jgi:UrcA family protein